MCATCGCGSAEARVAGRILSGADDPKGADRDLGPQAAASAVPTCLRVMGRRRVHRRLAGRHVQPPHEPAATRMTPSRMSHIAEPEARIVAAAGY